MTTIVPRGPYSDEELRKLYPSNLKLQLVQILLRHGERSPVSARFQNNLCIHLTITADWPYCNAAKRFSSVLMTKTDWSTWDDFQWRRRIETFGDDDRPVLASGPKGLVDTVCQLGELTDKGRETTLALGERLRHLYIDQLGFMPRIISDADMIYMRATPMARALDSVQQSFVGMYPSSARTASFPPPTIITRAPADETLFPNESNCRRFSQLSRAFAQRTADRWNNSTEMDYLNSLISKWMPDDSPHVAVDSHPRISGIMDTINSTLAHGPKTRLPTAFYDPKGRDIIDQIGTEEWFSGYKESEEYRKLGIGALVGDIVGRMVGSAEGSGNDGLLEVAGIDGDLSKGRGGESGIKFAMSGCHDTTLAAVLSSLGAFQSEKWPPYTSHIAVELFRDDSTATEPSPPADSAPRQTFLGASRKSTKPSSVITRKPSQDLTAEEKEKLQGYFVRLRYNDRPMVVPGCRLPGKHLEGDESFCTLEAFKAIADKFTPRIWTEACSDNLDEPAFPPSPEPAGL
ncbi:MAG: hypothetical protein LQ352_005253 [Teloschistes flavicans]|nr:MAG: hypothetical protein LQ352_005253 [Teloschistes flavicans]